ncbi:hypothetical protein GO755_04295 [Spirosoma sp. HMF4905]|uniref:Lipoprotein n=1 Tax=Spirosoma arboris TaxID=2682092 RepID=A0A7K1S5Z4_9BACT|nr:hypothetical protein [Spirosoma arboris]MVM29242.1 hypothetical protein [Spirosoma arboris]
MRALINCFFTILILTSCSGKKTATSTAITSAATSLLKTLPDSIDAAIGTLDRRLDIKMKRKTYEPQPGNLVTIQKWFEFGDTTRLVKLREEILTGDTKMDVSQYHFLNGKLVQIHEYQLNKKCAENGKQCMDEAKYYFTNDSLKVGVQRHAEGTESSPPQIETQSFQAVKPGTSFVTTRINKLATINKKYASLPNPKPKEEKGTH